MNTQQHYTILLVEDSPEDRATYRRYLQQAEGHAYTFLEAESAESAFALCQQALPDAILLDYNLPDQDGLAFLKQWFQEFAQALVPVIVLTGEGNEMIAAQAFKQGAADYQVKANLTAERLNTIVSQTIQQFQFKQTENRLKEQEELLKLFIQYAPVEIAMFDREMCYLMASQRWIKAYHLRSMESILYHSHYEIFPEIPEHWRIIHQRCLAGATEQCDDELFIRADGSRQWVSWEIRPWQRATGEIGGIIIFSQDVTSRKRAEIALQEVNSYLEKRVQERTEELQIVNDQLSESLQNLQRSQQETEDLYNNAPCGYHSLDAEGVVIRMNNTELNWLGYSREEVINKKHYTDFFTTEGKRIFAENFSRFKRQGWLNNLELELCHRDGSSRWVSVSATVVKDDQGDFLMSRTTLFDVSDRRRTEQALQHQFQQQNLFLTISQAIRQTLDLEMILNTTVQEIQQMLLVDRAAIYRFNADWSGEFIVEAVDSQWLPLVNFTGKKVWNDTYLQETEGGRFRHQENFIIPDIYQANLQDCHVALLEQFQAKAYAVFPILTSEKLWGLLAVYQNSHSRDWEDWEIDLLEQIANQLAIAIYQSQLYQRLEKKLREQQQIEEALRQSKEQFELVIKASNDGFWDWNVLTNEIYYSPRWKAMFGYEDHELPNQLATWEKLIFPEDSQTAWQMVEDCKNGKVEQFFMTQRFTHKKSHTVYVNSRAIHVKNEQGQIIRMVGSHSDITEMMTIQQALETSQQGLQETTVQLQLKLNELEQRRAELQTLGDMSEFLQACTTIEEACQSVSVFIETLFPHCSGSIALINTSRSYLEILSCWGESCYATEIFSANDCWALRRGKIHAINPKSQVLKCRHFYQIEEAMSSCCIPMIAQGETMGVFYLWTTQAKALDSIQQPLAIAIAEQLSVVIANLTLREKLEHQSIRDPLTALFNRRYLEEFLLREFHRATRSQYPISLIMLDVDHFKQFNDTWGHDAGDFVLKEIASLLKKLIRASDIACRYGGEEMTLVLSEVSLEMGLKKAEEIRTAIANLNLTHNGQTLPPVTASLGLACFPEQGTTYQELIKNADNALYQAKHQGRNQVVAYSDSAK